MKKLSFILLALLSCQLATPAWAQESTDANRDPIKYYAQQDLLSGYQAGKLAPAAWYDTSTPNHVDGSAWRAFGTCSRVKDAIHSDKEFTACLALERFNTATAFGELYNLKIYRPIEYETRKFACEEHEFCAFRVNYNDDPKTATTWFLEPLSGNRINLLMSPQIKANVVGTILKDHVKTIKIEVPFEGGFKPVFTFDLQGLEPLKILTDVEQKELVESVRK